MVCRALLQGSVLFSSLELLFPLSSQPSPASLASCYFLNILGTYSISICTDHSLCLESSSPDIPIACSLMSFRSLLKSHLLSQAFPSPLFQFHYPFHTSYHPSTLSFSLEPLPLSNIPYILYIYLIVVCLPPQGCKLHDSRAFCLL